MNASAVLNLKTPLQKVRKLDYVNKEVCVLNVQVFGKGVTLFAMNIQMVFGMQYKYQVHPNELLFS